MHLTQFSDYGLRLVLYLASHPSRLVSVEEVGRSYRISRHHLVTVVAALTELGVVESRRGRGGGMKLAMEPSRINLGWLVRETEPHFKIVECFDLATNTCPIAPACGLKGALLRAQQAFLEVLDGYTIDSFRARRAELVTLLEQALLRDSESEVDTQTREKARGPIP